MVWEKGGKVPGLVYYSPRCRSGLPKIKKVNTNADLTPAPFSGTGPEGPLVPTTMVDGIHSMVRFHG